MTDSGDEIQVHDTHEDLGDIVKKIVSTFDKPAGMSEGEYVHYSILTHWRLIYEDGNPLAAWCAYRYARREKCDIPDWVFLALDNAAINLSEMTSSDPVSIANALDMRTEKGGKTFAETLSAAAKSLALAHRYLVMKRRGMTDKAARDAVASRYDWSDATVKAAWDRYRASLGFPADKSKKAICRSSTDVTKGWDDTTRKRNR